MCCAAFISQPSCYDSPGASARRYNTLSASDYTCPDVWTVPSSTVPDPCADLSACPHTRAKQGQSGHPRLQLPHGTGQRQLWQGKHIKEAWGRFYRSKLCLKKEKKNKMIYWELSSVQTWLLCTLKWNIFCLAPEWFAWMCAHLVPVLKVNTPATETKCHLFCTQSAPLIQQL